jgi:hypothetical protein
VTPAELDKLPVNTIRGLWMDAIQQANLGHLGTPMDIAPVAHLLWPRLLCFDPADPIWPNRDRFVVPEGHASALTQGGVSQAARERVAARQTPEGTPEGRRGEGYPGSARLRPEPLA